MEKPFDQTWDEMTAYVEDVFFTNLNRKINGEAVDLAAQIKKNLDKQLDHFFSDLARSFPSWKTQQPFWVGEANVRWNSYSHRYADFKDVDRRGINFFVLTGLTAVARRKHKLDRHLRKARHVRSSKKTGAVKGALKSPSLQQEIAGLGNPSEYWGDAIVTVESHMNTDGKGVRRYNRGTTRQGRPMHSGSFRSPTSDFVTITIDWLPALTDQDVTERGVTEDVLPGDVPTKLMNREWRADTDEKGNRQQHKTGGDKSVFAYRPLLGPYMLWYQHSTVRDIIKNVSLPYGPQL